MHLNTFEINHKPSDILWLMLIGHLFLKEGVAKNVTIDEKSLNKMRTGKLGGKLILIGNLHLLTAKLPELEYSDIEPIVNRLMRNTLLDGDEEKEYTQFSVFHDYEVLPDRRLSVTFSDRMLEIIHRSTWTQFCLRHISRCHPSKFQDRVRPLQPFENLFFSTAPMHLVLLTTTLITLDETRTNYSLHDIQLKLGEYFQNAWIPSTRLMKKMVAMGVEFRLLHVEIPKHGDSTDELLTIVKANQVVPMQLIVESHQLLQEVTQSLENLIDNLFFDKSSFQVNYATISDYYSARRYIEFSILAFAQRRAPFTAAQFVQWWNRACSSFKPFSQLYAEQLLLQMKKELIPHTTKDGTLYYYLSSHGHAKLLIVRTAATGIESRLCALRNGFVHLDRLFVVTEVADQ